MKPYSLEETAIWGDVRKIIYTGKKPIKYEVRGLLHTEKEDIPVYKIESIDEERDFVNRVSTFIRIRFMMTLGDYTSRLYPYRANLEFTVKEILQEETSNEPSKKPKTNVERYKAIFLPTLNPVIAAGTLDQQDKESLNKMSFITVELELHNRVIEPLRIKQVRGVFQNVNQKQIIQNLLAGESAKVLVDGKPAIQGVDIAEPDNKEVYKHVIIPEGTHLTSLTTVMQEKIHGIYGTGIGTFLQKYNERYLWFVYPLFRLDRFKEDVDKLIIYGVPEDRFPWLDRTYHTEGKTTSIVITGNRKYHDAADIDYMNRGSGFRLTDARAIMKKPVEMTPEGPVGKRANLNHEVSKLDRKDGLNYGPVASRALSNNPYVDYSKVNARSVGRMDLVWENADRTKIYPGMPCSYVFLVDNKVVRKNGIVLYCYFLTALIGSKTLDNTYRTQCHLTIAIEPYDSEPETPKAKSYGVF